MKIAVTYENGQIFQHFGRTEMFKIYEVENGEVTNSKLTGTNGFGHGALAEFLKSLGVEVLICGGIGCGAQAALAEAGIILYGGVTGYADSTVNAFVNGMLSCNPNIQCSHHGNGHNCGNSGKCH